MGSKVSYFKADSRFVPSQWETSLQSNAVSHWLGANLESAMDLNTSVPTNVLAPNGVEPLVVMVRTTKSDMICSKFLWLLINTLRPRQTGCHFPDDIYKCIFLNAKVWISINISLKFINEGPIINMTILVQIMAWRRPGDKPLSEPMMVNLLTHIWVTRPQWVKAFQ